LLSLAFWLTARSTVLSRLMGWSKTQWGTAAGYG